jgi:hypothetical protein
MQSERDLSLTSFRGKSKSVECNVLRCHVLLKLKLTTVRDEIRILCSHISPSFFLIISIMFVEFGDLISKPEETVTQVMQFVGVDAAKNRFHEIAVHSGDHRGRRMHPAVRRKLQHYFAVPNQRLFALLGRDFSWSDEIAVDEEQGGGMAASLPVLRSDSTRMRVQPVRLMPGRGVSLGRKDSGLVKRVFSVNASSKA